MRGRRPVRVSRTAVAAVAVAILVLTAGCGGPGDIGGGVENGTTAEAVTTELTPDQTTEATPEQTTEATSEPTAEPDTPADGNETASGGEDVDGAGGPPLALWLLGGLLLVGVLFVIARSRRPRDAPPSAPAPTASTPAAGSTRSDADTVVALLHDHRGRLFEDDVAETASWSPARTRRVVDGLVATGDVVRRETPDGTLIVFADPGERTGADAVLAVLDEHNGRMFEADVADTLDWSRDETRTVVDALVEEGTVVRREVEGEPLVVRSTTGTDSHRPG